MMADQKQSNRSRVTTGITGLDDILYGGLPDGRVYLVAGGPGAGKTTIGLQFLYEGLRRDERVLFISLLQTRDELRDVSQSHGWSVDQLNFIELPEDVRDFIDAEQTVFEPAEVELHEVTDAIITAINKHRPQRLVLDSLSELEAIVESRYQMRRQLVKIKRALLGLDEPCTSLFTSGESVVQHQPTVQTIVHGAIRLSIEPTNYGEPRRQLTIEKIRGMDFDGGQHDMTISTGGLVVYPTLIPVNKSDDDTTAIVSGNDDLDALFGGGLNRGSTCLVMGTSGVGKTTLATHYVATAAQEGQYVSIYCFDEGRRMFLNRSRGLKLGIDPHIESGRVRLNEPNPGRLSPGQLLDQIRRDVTERDAKLVVIDSYTGLLDLMDGQKRVDARIHALLNFLTSQNILTLITVNLSDAFGRASHKIDTSYLADTVVLMRHFEAMGQVRRCISVLKKRHGDHERAIREIEFSVGGLRLGPPLEEFSGVLTGSPRYEGRVKDLLDSDQGGQGE